LERMGIAHLAHRYPHEMSGGQQQRVAMARALAAAPAVLLLDEPFAALDVPVRERLQQDLRAVQGALGLSVVYVTHSLDDAFAVGHRLAVIQEGHIEQIGPIEEVFSRPMNHDIAVIMGIRNLIHARVVEATPERLLLDWDGLPLEAPPQALDVGAIVTAYIRPEEVKVLYPDRPLTSAVSHNQILGRIVDGRLNVGFRTLRVSMIPHGHEVEVRFPVYAYTPLSLQPGAEVRLSLRREGVVILHPSKARVSD